MKSQHKMNCYVWSGLTPQRKKISGEVFALSVNFAKVQLNKKNISLLKIRKKYFFASNNITANDILIFLQQLSVLIDSGIPILQSCEILEKAQKKISVQNLISTMKTEMESGKTLAESLNKFPRHFNSLTCYLLRAGEESGTLDIMLKKSASYLEKSLLLRKQIQHALFYPIVIGIIASLVTTLMLVFVIPRFAELFENMHVTLPVLTRSIILISVFFRKFLWIIFIAIFLVAIIKPLKFFPRLMIFLQQCQLKCPGHFFQRIMIAKFSRSLATLISAGIPIAEALTLSSKMNSNFFYVAAIQQLHSDVTSGKQLYMAMLNSAFFPSLTIQMVKVGEEAGKMDLMLEKMADMYEAEIEHIIKNLNHMLEPIIMVVLGVIIGVLVIAMYLPIFNLSSLV